MIAAGIMLWFAGASLMAITRGGGKPVRRVWLVLLVLSAGIYFNHPAVTL